MATRTDLETLIDRYNQAWNAHDVDAIMAMHAIVETKDIFNREFFKLQTVQIRLLQPQHHHDAHLWRDHPRAEPPQRLLGSP